MGRTSSSSSLEALVLASLEPLGDAGAVLPQGEERRDLEESQTEALNPQAGQDAEEAQPGTPRTATAERVGEERTTEQPQGAGEELPPAPPIPFLLRTTTGERASAEPTTEADRTGEAAPQTQRHGVQWEQVWARLPAQTGPTPPSFAQGYQTIPRSPIVPDGRRPRAAGSKGSVGAELATGSRGNLFPPRPMDHAVPEYHARQGQGIRRRNRPGGKHRRAVRTTTVEPTQTAATSSWERPVTTWDWGCHHDQRRDARTTTVEPTQTAASSSWERPVTTRDWGRHHDQRDEGWQSPTCGTWKDQSSWSDTWTYRPRYQPCDEAGQRGEPWQTDAAAWQHHSHPAPADPPTWSWSWDEQGPGVAVTGCADPPGEPTRRVSHKKYKKAKKALKRMKAKFAKTVGKFKKKAKKAKKAKVVRVSTSSDESSSEPSEAPPPPPKPKAPQRTQKRAGDQAAAVAGARSKAKVKASPREPKRHRGTASKGGRPGNSVHTKKAPPPGPGKDAECEPGSSSSESSSSDSSSSS